MAIVFTNQSTPDISSGTDLASYDSASWTPPAELVFVFVMSRNVANTGPAIPTMSGNSITWVNIISDVRTTGIPMRLTLFAADGTNATAGVTTIAFDGETQTAALASFASAANVDLTAGAAAAFVQSVSAISVGVSAGSVTLAAESDADNRPISGWARGQITDVTPATSWTELDDLVNGTNRGLETQYRDDAFDTAAAATWTTNTTVIGIAAELKISAAGVAKELRRHVVKSQAVHRASRW